MSSIRLGLLSLGLSGTLLLPPVPAGRMVHGPGSAQGATVVVNEVLYDPPATGSETAYEWVELMNTGLAAVSLNGWQLADAKSANVLPDVTIAPGEFLVVAAGGGFAELNPGFTGHVVTLGGRIGNGLGNNGDQVRLLAPDGQLVDGLSYGDDAGLLSPPAPDVPAEHSLERVPAGADTDTAADWVDQSVPTPGQSGGAARPTASPTAAPPPTVVPGTGPVLNEYLPAPKDIDWDGDGQATTADEWIELFNPSGVELNLRGWQLDDVADGGSAPFVMPEGTVLAPRGYLVIFAKASKLQLNNGGDSVRLLTPDGQPTDETTFTKSAPDASYARLGDGNGPWTDTLPPSPGLTNPVGSAPSPTSPAAPTAGASPTGHPTVHATSTASPTPRQPGGTPAPAYLPLLISEVLPAPVAGAGDAAGEWVELFNRGDKPVALAGWAVGDGAGWDTLPAVVVPARSFVVVTASDAEARRLAAQDTQVVTVPDGRIGNGLANAGDVVRLRGPTGQLADAVSYGVNLAAFDPAVPLGPPGTSLERLPPDVDTDSADDWWPQPAPSPGRQGQRSIGPIGVVLNEVLPAPARIDWDGNRLADHTDEWIELYNPGPAVARLAGWRLQVGVGGAWQFRLPAGLRLAPGAFLVLPRAQTGLALVNDGDVVRLARDDGTVVDALSWSVSPGYDRSIGRVPDGHGHWFGGLSATPGQPNRAPQPTALPPRVAGESAPESGDPLLLSGLRSAAVGRRVRVRGQVTVPPGAFGPRVAYVGDAGAGVMLYLSGRDGALPPLALGAWVVAVGRLADLRGEREIVIERRTDVWVEGMGAAVVPTALGTGSAGEAVEGRLVAATGRVVVARGASLDLDDGSGVLRVVIHATTGAHVPPAALGKWLRIVGVVGQSAARAPWVGGYHLVPRGPGDIATVSIGGSGRGALPARRTVRLATGKSGTAEPRWTVAGLWRNGCCIGY